MEVRPATPADAERVLEVHVAAIRAFGPDAYDERQVEAWARVDDRIPDYPIGESGDHFVVAVRAGEIAGFGHLVVDEKEVTAVYVHPEHAREGVGSALLAHLEGVAYGLGLEELELRASLNAVPFYRAAGYERVAEATHETSPDGVELPVVDMRKRLFPAQEL